MSVRAPWFHARAALHVARVAGAAGAVTGAVGCSQEAMLRRVTPPDADARARDYLAMFTEHRGDLAAARLLPALDRPKARRYLAQIDSLLGGQRFDSVRVVGVRVNTVNGIRHTDLTYQLRSQMGWTLANVVTVDSAATWFVEGFHVQYLPGGPLDAQTTFTLGGRTPLHYVWLLLMAGCAGVSLAVAARLATACGMPKRWRWAAASLVGVGGFHMNWATGRTEVQPIYVQLLAAGAERSGPVAPRVLTFAAPLGAVLAHERYRRWRGRPEMAPDDDL